VDLGAAAKLIGPRTKVLALSPGTDAMQQVGQAIRDGAQAYLAKQVKAAGIKEIKGDVLIDDRLFIASEGSGSGPRVVSPMIANDNLIDQGS